jgi:lipopolysaccharide export system protein LptC
LWQLYHIPPWEVGNAAAKSKNKKKEVKMIRVYVRRTPREKEVMQLLGTTHMTINREVGVDESKRETAKSLEELGLIEVRNG